MDVIKYLLSIETKGIKLGLQRTEQMMFACRNPHIKLPAIQVAGTNGKGSVCAMLANIFKVAGYNTGLFTSPHLVSVNERIRINGVPINNKDIKLFINKYKKDIEKIGATFFETITAMALWYFKLMKVDIAILETGLGGRLDSVSICKPILTIMTPISLDHIEILGDSLEKIAYEKAGILKKDIQCISAKQEDVVEKVLLYESNKKGAFLKFISNKKQLYDLNIAGNHQQENAKLVVNSISYLNQYKINKNNIINGLKTVKWYGRNQIIKLKPLVIFDVAHNVSSMQSFINYYSSLNIKEDSILIISLQNRKNIDSVIPLLISNFKHIVCTEADGRSTMPVKTLSNLFPKNKTQNIKKPQDAVKWGLQNIHKNGALAITGSHYLGSTISKAFKISFDKY